MKIDYIKKKLPNEENELYLSLDGGSGVDRLQSTLMKGEQGRLRDEYIIKYKPVLIEVFISVLIPGNSLKKDYKPEDDISNLNKLFEDYPIERDIVLDTIYDNRFKQFCTVLNSYLLDWLCEQYWFCEASTQIEVLSQE